MSSLISHLYRFGDFAVDMDQRILLRDDRPLPLAPKVFETLVVLVEKHGRIVEKEDLMDRLWPDSFVEECNLTFNIQQLRRVLGDKARQPRYVETVARRGYRFIAEVEEVLAETSGIKSHVSVRPNESESGEGNGLAARQGEPRGGSLGADRMESEEESVRSRGAIGAEVAGAIPASMMRLFIAAAVVVALLLTAALSAWHFGAGSSGNQSDHPRVGVVSPPALPLLKFEKLTETGKDRKAVISPDGEYVAYTIEVEGRQSIWLRQLATGTSKEIVSISERLGGLTFAHSGEHLYFVKGPPSSWAMYRVTLPLGGVPVRLIDKPEGGFSLSPEDAQIAFIRYSSDDKECALMIADADGSHQRALVVHAQPDRFNSPAWSPDGQTIAVAAGESDSGGQQVRITEFGVADGSEREVPAGRWFNISRIVWLPDHSGLLVVGNRRMGESKQIWRVSYPGGEVNQITAGPTAYIDISITDEASKAVAVQTTFASNVWVGPAGEPQNLKRITHAVGDFCWTTDGRLIYSSTANVKTNLWEMQPDGTEQKQLTDSERDAGPVVTKDGRYIIFISNRSGALQIWRMDAGGSNPVQLTKGIGVNRPAVSPDGQWIVYNTVDDWTLWKISIDGGEPMRLTKSFAVNPSVSPDGKLIACVGKKDDKADRRLMFISSESGELLREFGIAPLRLSSFRLSWTADGNAVRYAASRAELAGIYSQSIKGGAPKKLIELNEDDIFDFGYSRDDRQLAMTRGGWQFDAVLIRDFNR